MDHIQKLLSYLFSAVMELDTLAMFPSSNFYLCEIEEEEMLSYLHIVRMVLP